MIYHSDERLFYKTNQTVQQTTDKSPNQSINFQSSTSHCDSLLLDYSKHLIVTENYFYMKFIQEKFAFLIEKLYITQSLNFK
jgi:hypothetical protein